jgi:hypothetical protein
VPGNLQHDRICELQRGPSGTTALVSHVPPGNFGNMFASERQKKSHPIQGAYGPGRAMPLDKIGHVGQGCAMPSLSVHRLRCAVRCHLSEDDTAGCGMTGHSCMMTAEHSSLGYPIAKPCGTQAGALTGGLLEWSARSSLADHVEPVRVCLHWLRRTLSFYRRP